MSDRGDLLEKAAREAGASPAFVTDTGVRTYADLNAEAIRLVSEFSSQGLRRGDRLAIALPGSVESVTLLHACFRYGIVAFPVNPKLPVAAQTALCEQAGCTAHIGKSTPSPLALPEISLGSLTQAGNSAKQSGKSGFDPGNPAVIVATSGSSGTPKCALLRYSSLYHNAAISNRNIPLQPGDRWLLSLPLYHVSGLGVVFRCLAARTAVAMPPMGMGLAEAIVQLGVTHLSLVPAQLHGLLKENDGRRALGKVRAILLGGSAIPEGLLRDAVDAGLPIHTTYGLTEMASQVATTRAGDHIPEPRRSAPVFEPGTVRLNAQGEIEVSGASLFAGYLEDGQLATRFKEDGWFPTGDLGEWEEDERLRVLGRRDNQFISGGENIHPEEIERELLCIEGIERAVVAPIPDETYGQRPVAFVALAQGSSLDAVKVGSIEESLKQRLPSYKLPDRYYDWPGDLAGEGIKPRRALFAARALQRAGEGQAGPQL